jgi:hypothetical protein
MRKFAKCIKGWRTHRITFIDSQKNILFTDASAPLIQRLCSSRQAANSLTESSGLVQFSSNLVFDSFAVFLAVFLSFVKVVFKISRTLPGDLGGVRRKFSPASVDPHLPEHTEGAVLWIRLTSSGVVARNSRWCVLATASWLPRQVLRTLARQQKYLTLKVFSDASVDSFESVPPAG